jgi:hypothetical protein
VRCVQESEGCLQDWVIVLPYPPFHPVLPLRTSAGSSRRPAADGGSDHDGGYGASADFFEEAGGYALSNASEQVEEDTSDDDDDDDSDDGNSGAPKAPRADAQYAHVWLIASSPHFTDHSAGIAVRGILLPGVFTGGAPNYRFTMFSPINARFSVAVQRVRSHPFRGFRMRAPWLLSSEALGLTYQGWACGLGITFELFCTGDDAVGECVCVGCYRWRASLQ